MKTKLFTIALSVFFALSLSMPSEVSARNHKTPFWAKAHCYREQTRQVYFPEYNMYYDRQEGTYIYIDNGRWSVSLDLPIRFGSRSLVNARYVELNENSNAPRYYNNERRGEYRQVNRYNNDDRRYAEGRRDNRREDQYRNNREEKQHNNWNDRDEHHNRDDRR